MEIIVKGKKGAILDEFLVYFNSKKQWISVYLHDVHPTTFANWKGGRWGFFVAKWSNPKSGLFGEIHLVKSRARVDLVAHELFHALCEWMWANREPISNRSEEMYASMMDELTRNFYKEYKKLKGSKHAVNI